MGRLDYKSTLLIPSDVYEAWLSEANSKFEELEGQEPSLGCVSKLSSSEAKKINRVPVCVHLSTEAKATEFRMAMGNFAMQLVKRKKARILYASPVKPQNGFTALSEIKPYVNG